MQSLRFRRRLDQASSNFHLLANRVTLTGKAPQLCSLVLDASNGEILLYKSAKLRFRGSQFIGRRLRSSEHVVKLVWNRVGVVVQHGSEKLYARFR